MRFRFVDDDLQRLYEDQSAHHPRFGVDVVTSFRKKVAFIQACETMQDVRSMRSLHLEQLKGDRKGQQSIRLNDQWRLIFETETDNDGALLAIITIVDYH